MLIGPTLISLLLPLQLHIHDLTEWRHEGQAYLHIAYDAAYLIGLPNLKNKFPVQNHNPELYLREADRFDRPPSRRKVFVLNFLRQMRTYSH